MIDVMIEHIEGTRNELNSYLCRLVVRPQVAEELVQTTFLKCVEASDSLPIGREGLRAWIFKVATNLAFDQLRRHSTWRETMVVDLRVAFENGDGLVERSKALIGTPETKAIAREHLLACFACTLRNLPENRAAALLLKEVHGFSRREICEILDAAPGQVKNWLQEARDYMSNKYSMTCALIAKNGVCYQCVELDGFFSAGQGNPLATDGSLAARLEIAGQLREKPWGRWHRVVFDLIDDIL